jgi:hypothetical protein
MEVTLEERQAVVSRVLASATFERSRQLKALLQFVCDRALRDEPEAFDDVDIARALLGAEAVDPSAGSLVRAQASLLRKKLESYFRSEGTQEAIVLELARGSYQPTFRVRTADEGAAATIPSRPRARRAAPVLVALACAFALGRLWPHGSSSAPPSAHPDLDRLWRQMFGNGRPTELLVSDAGVTQFQDLLGRQLALGEYERERMDALLDEHIRDPNDRRLARKALEQRQTAMSDLALANRVQSLQAAQGLAAFVLLAREGKPTDFESHNVILSGPRRANPWIELFEPRLNFRSEFDETIPTDKRSSLVNVHPQPGEQARYAVNWGVRGFCRVAYLPGLDGRGSVLIVSGTDLSSTGAGAEFITSEAGVHLLRRHLGLGEDRPVPYFEVLLSAPLVVSSSAAPEWVAHRVIAP